MLWYLYLYFISTISQSIYAKELDTQTPASRTTEASTTDAKKVKRQYYTPQSYYDDLSLNVYNRGRGLNAPININQNEAHAPIIKQIDNREPDGSYNYEYETANGIRAQESSIQNGVERIVRGSYSYTGPDGKIYTVNYIADRNGYRAYGSHLPVQPDQISPISRQENYFHNTPIITSTIRPPVYNIPLTSTGVDPFYTISSTTPSALSFSTTPVNVLPVNQLNPQILSTSTQRPFTYNPSTNSLPSYNNINTIFPTQPTSFGLSNSVVNITPPPRRNYVDRNLSPPFGDFLPISYNQVPKYNNFGRYNDESGSYRTPSVQPLTTPHFSVYPYQQY